MPQNTRSCRCRPWLGAGLLLSLCLGCQGRETPATRDAGSGTPAASAPADNPAHRHDAGPATAANHDEREPAPANKVSIDNFTFHPETLVITAGTKVVWINGDDVPHTVRSNENTFRSGTLDTDDVYEHEFPEPGTYEYYCGVHRHMTGKIVVKKPD